MFCLVFYKKNLGESINNNSFITPQNKYKKVSRHNLLIMFLNEKKSIKILTLNPRICEIILVCCWLINMIHVSEKIGRKHSHRGLVLE